jgi:electron transport complex protein RnfB
MLIAIGTMGSLMLLLAAMLIAASRRFHVDEDPRIDTVETLLPGVNCGACGYPGCRQFAEALVGGQSAPGQCTVSTEAEKQRVAQFLGVKVGEIIRQVARLACAGGDNVARPQAVYHGMATCQAATQVAGGGKSCAWGCLGYGDCERSCQFDAITMNQHRLPVVSETLCTSCGDCVETCPKDLFSLHPMDHRLWVACNNHEFGDEITQHCQVACTACGRCAMDAPDQLIHMQDNLPVVNYTKPHHTQAPIERCPTGAIVWLQADGAVTKGREAKHIIRQQPLMPLPS